MTHAARLLALLLAVLLVPACAPRPHRAIAAAPASVGEPAALSVAEIARRATPAVVLIRAGANRLGTGFVVSPRGLIATNLHVVAGAAEAVVTLADGRVFRDPEVLGYDKAHDIAVLHVPADDLPALTLTGLAGVHPGDRVVAIGHPLGLGNTVSDGLVSGVRVVDESMTLLQISAPIAPGSSGGPLLDERGSVIGIATLIVTQGQNLNFGVPATYLGPILLSGTPRPLAVVARETADGAPAARPIPEHDPKVLDRCSAEELDLLTSSIDHALTVGAPLFDQGNAEACYRVLEGTALRLGQKLRGCGGARRLLAEGVDRADRRSDAGDKAWALYDTFAGLFRAAEKRQKR
jgi:hypothetical protein